VAATGSEERPREPASVEDLDDEPLPTSYGMGSVSRPQEPRVTESGRRDGEERSRPADGEERSGGRRRRRRGGEGRSSGTRQGRPRGEGQPATEPARERSRGSRRGLRDEAAGGSRSDDRRSSSRSSRGRRSDFAPVSTGYDEDDEGLEFLGVEEAGRDTVRRETRPEDDDVLTESGLNTVLDVPSWIEAIGIVIAGNLDARSRSGRGDGGRSRDR
jgi:hypothetical protein